MDGLVLDLVLDLRDQGAGGDVHDPAAAGAGDHPDLPYPDGRAAAEVLKVGSGTREMARRGPRPAWRKQPGSEVDL